MKLSYLFKRRIQRREEEGNITTVCLTKKWNTGLKINNKIRQRSLVYPPFNGFYVNMTENINGYIDGNGHDKEVHVNSMIIEKQSRKFKRQKEHLVGTII